ncbi:aldehyde dehydrogenase (NADP(+)) [Microbacterium dauci]|uniref:Aldehyde dehydrogenase (NADP(+)) n=1 Tax=Microbacterium dauci TaxID=3048008 RepID=A0ABT6ZDW3_9MICO|nr:aldehyde dehydrogenase (NADP(+)) [Microbacterium sp. LX3-4]MDJ1113822.1 aldehyde dehydrogenase (NADP(+)) [Microbacterium sp. LX3-4]
MSVDDVVAAATAAVPAVGTATDHDRARWLRAVADRLDENAPELVALADEETHLGAPRLSGEVTRTTNQLRLFTEVITEGSYLEAVIDHARPDATPPQPDLRRMLRPLGPVAVFAASNFPFAFSVAGGDTASALAVGCPVVVKAHPAHPELSRRTAAVVQAALADAGAPAGAFGIVEGFDAGPALVQHPAVTAVAFTGSTEGGRALFDLAAGRQTPIPFYGELGSINPVVVFPAADQHRGTELAAGLVASMTLGAGQFCTKPGVVFVPRASSLESALDVPATSPQMLTPAMQAAFDRGVDDLLATPGVELIAGVRGGPLVAAAEAATVIATPELLRTEVFGAVTLLVRYDDASLPVALDSLEGSLTATVHADASDDVSDVVPRLERLAGRVLFDGWPTGVAVTWSQHHGGPFPATTSQFTSVGATAVRRFLRPIAYQNAPDLLLPPALQERNPLGVPRRVDGVLEPESTPVVRA